MLAGQAYGVSTTTLMEKHSIRTHQISTLLGQPAEMRALLTDPDERAPPTRIPEEWHIRLSLSERPATLDEMGGRFLWTAEREGACGRTRGGGCWVRVAHDE